MKKIFVLFFLLGIILISINSCEDALNSGTVIKVDTTVTGGVIWPIKIGNTWNLDITEYDTLGVFDTTYTDSFVDIRDTIINNEQWFIMQDGGIFRNGSDGVYIGNNRHSTFTPSLFLKYPANTGDSYTAIIDEDSTTIKVFAKVNVTVKAGTFFCYEYINTEKYTDQNVKYISERRFFFSPNNGFIKEECYDYKDGSSPILTRKYELTSYILK